MKKKKNAFYTQSHTNMWTPYFYSYWHALKSIVNSYYTRRLLYVTQFIFSSFKSFEGDFYRCSIQFSDSSESILTFKKNKIIHTRTLTRTLHVQKCANKNMNSIHRSHILTHLNTTMKHSEIVGFVFDE